MPDGPFLLFAFDGFYPGGGADDCRGVFATIDEAKAAALQWVEHGIGWRSHPYDLLAFDYYQIAALVDGDLKVLVEGEHHRFRRPFRTNPLSTPAGVAWNDGTHTPTPPRPEVSSGGVVTVWDAEPEPAVVEWPADQGKTEDLDA